MPKILKYFVVLLRLRNSLRLSKDGNKWQAVSCFTVVVGVVVVVVVVGAGARPLNQLPQVSKLSAAQLVCRLQQPQSQPQPNRGHCSCRRSCSSCSQT